MKWLLKLMQKFKPLFEKGPLKPLATIYETFENIMFSPLHSTPGAPHVRDRIEIKRYMTMVIVALMPSLLAAIYYFGPRVLAMIIVSYVVGGIVEVAFAVIRKHEIEEGFLVTGLIFPLTLPPTTPLWIVGVGILFGTMFGKEVFGGTGRNIFNPALVGRLFVTIAFPSALATSWFDPAAGNIWTNFGLIQDAVTSATPLGAYKGEFVVANLGKMLVGYCAGSTGETFRLGIILGGVFLMFTRVANWRVPVTYLASVALFAFLGNKFLGERIAPAHFQLLAGGLLFGAMFMATDPVTSPVTKLGKFVFGISCGLLTVLIRAYSGYVEGVMFSIVIMNAFTPLIDHMVISRKYKPVTA